MARFAAAVDDEIDLVLTDDDVVDPIHRLVLAGLDHLSPWEDLARPGLQRSEVVDYVHQGRVAWADGLAIPTAIEYHGDVVGVVGARLAPAVGRAEIGYWIGAEHQGRGIVTRAVRAMVGLVLERDDMHRVELRMAAANVRSRAVAERLAFTLEGTLRSAYPIDGRRHDLCIYARLRTDA
ncbi:MAG TPA: GNAT family protein [Cellulomonas sp.]